MTQYKLTHPFDDHEDAYRVGYGRRTKPLDPDAPPDGFEPVLEIRIPVDAAVTTNDDGVPYLDITPRDDQTEWVPFPTDKDSGWSDFDGSVDRRLERELDAVFPVSGPITDPSSRMLVDITDPFHDRLLPDTDNPQLRQFLEGYLAALEHTHEADFDTSGSHAHLLLDPTTAASDNLTSMLNINEALFGDQHTAVPDVPGPLARLTRSKMFVELAALVAERQTADAVRTADSHPSIYQQTIRTVNASLAEIRATPPEQKISPIQTTPQQILAFLHDPATHGPALSLDRIQILLEAGRHVTLPDTYLAHLVRDLAATDGPNPADLPHHCSYWVGSQDDHDLATRRDEADRARSAFIEDAVDRSMASTFEAVSLKRDTLIRRWWARNPPRPFPIKILKHTVFRRRVLAAHRRRYGAGPALTIHQPPADKNGPMVEYHFRMQNTDPFAPARDPDTTFSSRCISDLMSSDERPKARRRAFDTAVVAAADALGFDGLNALSAWGMN